MAVSVWLLPSRTGKGWKGGSQEADGHAVLRASQNTYPTQPAHGRRLGRVGSVRSLLVNAHEKRSYTGSELKNGAKKSPDKPRNLGFPDQRVSQSTPRNG